MNIAETTSRGIWKQIRSGLGLVTVACVLIGCGASTAHEDSSPRVAVSNSYLEAAVRDLMEERVALLRLAEPGSCPGHFDLRPSQARQLRDCRILFRFDFQEGLDVRAQGTGSSGPTIAIVTPAGGLGVPATYLDACRQTGAALVAAGLLGADELEARLEQVRDRLEQLSDGVRAQVVAAGLPGRPVVISHRQEAFASWLGLDVIARFSAADTARPSEIERVIQSGRQHEAPLVIANEPEGTRLAQALAERLRVGMIVWANFPTAESGEAGFDTMLLANIRRLISAVP
jgi:zinc transport system substrate-binding protein